MFARLESLPFPTVALIYGACVGGGLELALACRFRVASKERSTQLGLPEVQLGILPGFGGTQRLPRLLGLTRALPLLLTGKLLSASRSRRTGLVDDLAPRGSLEAAALRLVERGRNRRPRQGGALESLLAHVGPARRLVLSRARKEVLAKSHGLFPAPLKILESVEAGYAGGDGYETESRLLGELIVDPVSRNLVRLYQMSERARDVGETGPALERALVVGAGTMGAGIVGAFAGAGIRTRMVDSSGPALVRAMQSLRRAFQRKNRSRGGSPADLNAVLDRVEPSQSLTGLGRQQLFLEAIIEDLDVKRDLFRDAQRALPPDAWIATNTSSLDLDRMAEVLDDPSRLVGIHFFNPVHRMRLVEIVRGRETSDEAVAMARGLVRRLGKVPVVVKNAPGFLVNRLLTPYLLEAERLVEEGASVLDVDACARAAGMPMGPLELLDEVGLDVAAHVAQVMHDGCGERFEPGTLVKKLRDQGHLGKKTRRGFYRYGKSRDVNPALPRPSLPRDPTGEWQDRLILPVVAEAMRCLEEGIVATEEEVDLAMLLGTGFQLAAGGPLHAAHQRGRDEVVAALQRLEERHGPRFAVPARLGERAHGRQEVVA